jgi:hypothetical protein
MGRYLKQIPVDKVIVQVKMTPEEARALAEGQRRRKEAPKKEEIVTPTRRATDIIERVLRVSSLRNQ